MKHQLILLSVLLAPLSVHADDINQRSEAVKTKLEVLNNLGLKCQAQLEVDGMSGANSQDCSKYLKNINGRFFQSIKTDCESIMKWYEEQQVFIHEGGTEFIENNPNEAQKLLTSMKLANGACAVESLREYTYITKPLATINSLSELE